MVNSARPILDAGPGLNFMSVNQERLLFKVTGRLQAPETVVSEMEHKASKDARFSASQNVLNKVKGDYLSILSDQSSPELNAAVYRICGFPLEVRRHSPKDLGEIMVIAHAAVLAENGLDVTVIIDDGSGRRLALQEQRRLVRLKMQGRQCGGITLLSTVGILHAAKKRQLIEPAQLKVLYLRMKRLDDGLLPFEKTTLNDS